jgi:type IV secretion system protein VirB8
MTDTPAPRLTLGKARPEYQQAATWAADIHGSLRASRRLAWTVAAAALAVAALEAIALALMAPLKTVVPYTVLVDRQTGYVETARGLQLEGPLTQDSAVTQSFLVQYVLARETFDATDLRENYRKVSLWSAGPVQTQYQRDMQRSNPASPLNLHSPSTVLAVTVKSVSLLSPTSALVRFDTTRREAGAASGEQRAYTAAISFRYSGAPMRTEDRFINPLGFQVTSYRRDSETVSGTVAAAPAVAIVPPPVQPVASSAVVTPPVVVPPVVMTQPSVAPAPPPARAP